MTHGAQTAWTIVNGRIVAHHGHLTGLTLPVLVEQHNRLATRLVA